MTQTIVGQVWVNGPSSPEDIYVYPLATTGLALLSCVGERMLGRIQHKLPQNNSLSVSLEEEGLSCLPRDQASVPL